LAALSGTLAVGLASQRREFLVSLVDSNAIKSYWSATRHPGPCLLFLAPLIVVYEIGVFKLGGGQPLALRNGADSWTRAGLAALSVRHPAAAPMIVAVILGLWFWTRRDTTPEETPAVCLGMAVESIAAALGLWAVSRGFSPLLGWLGVTVSTPPTLNVAAFGQVVTYIGAGIYEEILFRVVLFGGLCILLRTIGVGSIIAVLSSAAVAALLFAAAHHIGPHGEPVDSYNFLFRALAGLYFAALYQYRGFGIAVGAHTCYDIVVGIAM
jgi:membrane protease YdiL (CAAX protease family)